MYNKEFNGEENIDKHIKQDFDEKNCTSFTVNYVYNENSPLNLNSAFDFLFEEVMRQIRNQTFN